MAPAPSAGSTAKIVKLDASTNLTKSEKPKKPSKSGSSDSKQKKRKAGQEASSDDESEDDIVGQLPLSLCAHPLTGHHNIGLRQCGS